MIISNVTEADKGVYTYTAVPNSNSGLAIKSRPINFDVWSKYSGDIYLNLSLCMTKPTIWVSDQVQHKPACTVTEETQNLENLGISRGGNVLSV